MTEHTPTPWKVGHGPNKEVEIWGRMRMNASPILMSLGIMEHDPREANAAFIIKAVNNHVEAIGFLELASISLWRKGDHAVAREIDKFLDRVSPDSRESINDRLRDDVSTQTERGNG